MTKPEIPFHVSLLISLIVSMLIILAAQIFFPAHLTVIIGAMVGTTIFSLIGDYLIKPWLKDLYKED